MVTSTPGILKQKNYDFKIRHFIAQVEAKNPGESEFIAAVTEASEFLIPYIEESQEFRNKKLLERMVEPERSIIFRVPWMNDQGEVVINRGYRVQMNSAIGPFKGGLRFHPSVNLSVLKFLAFEQVLKNSLTKISMGGAKGGSDFDPKGKSDAEVMRFCQSFMTELYRYIGPQTDVPAGDVGVGEREIGYLFGQYKKLRNEFTGVLTGKGYDWGGSLIRPEATGYGCVYFAQFMLNRIGTDLKDKRVSISGSGNVALHAAEKAIQEGAIVQTMSDSGGTIFDPKGINDRKLSYLKVLKNEQRGRIETFAKEFKLEFFPNKNPWHIKTDVALPCAIENELKLQDAQHLINNNCILVCEGANMPVTLDAVYAFHNVGIMYAPGKASNAGGVAVSGLEMSQNAAHLSWDRDAVNKKLTEIMYEIHESCVQYGMNGKQVNYLKGANIAGFVRVAKSMLAQGLV